MNSMLRNVLQFKEQEQNRVSTAAKKLDNIESELFSCLKIVEKYQALKLGFIEPKWKKHLKNARINQIEIRQEIVFYGDSAIRKDYLIFKEDSTIKLILCYNIYPSDADISKIEYSNVSEKFKKFIEEKLNDEEYFVNILEKFEYPYHKELLQKINTKVIYK